MKKFIKLILFDGNWIVGEWASSDNNNIRVIDPYSTRHGWHQFQAHEDGMFNFSRAIIVRAERVDFETREEFLESMYMEFHGGMKYGRKDDS